jgi:CBS domain-containing protein
MTLTTPARRTRPRLVEDVYQPGVVTADFYDRLTDVARRMRENDIGAVVVFEEGDLAGILTEQDVLEAIADRVPLERTIAADYMMSDLVTVGLDTSLEEAGRLMWQAHIRHLPVMAGDRVVGMVSARDLLGIPADGT